MSELCGGHFFLMVGFCVLIIVGGWFGWKRKRKENCIMLYDLVFLGSGMYLMCVCVGLGNGRVRPYLGYLARRSLL